MPKCLFCKKENEEGRIDCQVCHKPLRASTAAPTNKAKTRPTARTQAPMPGYTPNLPTGYANTPPIPGYTTTPQPYPSQPQGYYQQQAQPTAGTCCPLCSRADGVWEKSKLLYDVPVCKKCSNDFSNRRLMAYIVDSFAWTFFPIFFIGVLRPFVPAELLAIPAMLLILFGFLLRDGFKGKSIGKMAMGLMVISETTGQPIGMKDSIIRNIPFYIPILPLVIAFQFNKGERFGDSWASTKVVWTKYAGYGPFADVQPMDGQLQQQNYSSRLGRV